MIETDMIDVVTGGNAERHDRFAGVVPLKRPADPSRSPSWPSSSPPTTAATAPAREFVVDGGMTSV